ncbi:MAG: uroporphyrinogen-III synthase [Saprospiraceae bacterium]|nr:MAG: uroporphyrinogen-III synthase [Saprospiraceae bacterium]
MEVINGKEYVETFKTVKTILVSQPKPERSPYYDLEEKYGLTIDWRSFIHVEAVDAKDFRKTRIRPDEFSAVIFTSKNSIDHFFRLCEEMRAKMSQDTKYFCMTEAVANYLQKFIVYRKRKVFAGFRTIQDLKPYLIKHKDKENFLLPCSNLGAKSVGEFLEENGFKWQEAMMYRTVSSDLSDLKDIYYDIIVFFSPIDIQALYENFPNFMQKETRIAVFGKSTCAAMEEQGLYINIMAPKPETPSMTMALEQYLQVSNKDMI